MDQDTIGKVADATGEVAKTADTALRFAGDFLAPFKDALNTVGKILGNEIGFVGAKRYVRLSEKLNELMAARGLTAPTRTIPANFFLPLASAAILEEDNELQDTWARLLVNAGDAATPMELRTAYVEILKGMSAFDVRILTAMVKVTLAIPDGYPRAVLTSNLPSSGKSYPGHFTTEPDLSVDLGVSLANLSRLGCANPGSGMDGSVLFDIMTVTPLGIALYKACS